MKILLINPPRSPENKILESAPDEAKHFIHKKLIGPPLGLLTIATAVKDFDVTVFDTKGEYDLDPDAPPLSVMVQKLLEQYNPDIVGVTVITSEFYFAIDIFQTVKNFNQKILTVAGGLHTTLCPNDFTDSSIDIICPGQSANIFREVVVNHEKNLPFESVEGIYINTPNGLKATKPLQQKWNPADENFLMPDRNHLERWRSTYTVGKAPYPSTYLFTSLGCPYRCTFCSIWKEHRGLYFQRQVESVIEELKLIDYKIVRFADANTIVNINFINRLFDRIAEEGIKKDYIMDIRADTAVDHPELIEKLAKGGLKVVICGFESFRNEELKKYNKKSKANKIHEAIDIFHNNDILLRGNYVIPNDYNEEDFQAMSEYANSHRVTYAGYTILTPMPGTTLYEQTKDQIIDHDLSKYNFFNSVMKTDLPLEKFYENVGNLWLIKKGSDII
ncbi:MAG: B12-binding domain-containing radical SAM protein [Bacteroidales bacterium]|nr:B12-binding domain-containing radical SAM protein [Bacteroidales bacterium]